MAAAAASVAAPVVSDLAQRELARVEAFLRASTMKQVEDVCRWMNKFGFGCIIVGAAAWLFGAWSEKAAQNAANDEVARIKAVAGAATAGTNEPVTWWDPLTWGNGIADAYHAVTDIPSAVWAAVTQGPHILWDSIVFTAGAATGSVLTLAGPMLLLLGVVLVVSSMILSENYPALAVRLKDITNRARGPQRAIVDTAMRVEQVNAEQAVVVDAAAGGTAAVLPPASGPVLPSLPPPGQATVGPATGPVAQAPVVPSEGPGAGTVPVVDPPTDRPTAPVEPTPTSEVEKHLGEPEALEPTADELRRMEKARRESHPDPEVSDTVDEPTGVDRMLAAQDAFQEAETVPAEA